VLPTGITVTEAERLGEVLRARRKHLGLSQDDVAGVVGVNRRVVGELERGKATVQLDIVLRVAGALGLDFEFRERR
jgi:y4mF family transcriptional regulator